MSVCFLPVVAQATNAHVTNYSHSVDVVLENDNPFLNLFPKIWAHSDDHGYTHGLKLNVTLVHNDGWFLPNEQWQVHIGTELYTEDRTPEGQDLFPYDPQVFNEITEWRVRWSDIFAEKETPYFNQLGLGLGRKNTRDDEGFGGVGQQRRWHHFKHHELTPTTTSMYANQKAGENHWYLIAHLAKGRSIAWAKDSMVNGSATFILGLEAKTYWKGSTLSLQQRLEQSLVRSSFGHLAFIMNNALYWHPKGQVEAMVAPGISMQVMGMQMDTGVKRYFGEPNQDFYQYLDDDDIWYIQVAYHW
ncbi:MAG: hypothetical protein OXE99_09450 [Cellvibrionales bacterium]|nr:hypothetical protein [Cellvibrionales bacterium]